MLAAHALQRPLALLSGHSRRLMTAAACSTSAQHNCAPAGTPQILWNGSVGHAKTQAIARGWRSLHLKCSREDIGRCHALAEQTHQTHAQGRSSRSDLSLINNCRL